MTIADWQRVIEQAARLGVWRVQFIGGEPTLLPGLPELIEHALLLGLLVEVYSNLIRVPDRLWEVLQRPGVSLATSWYSDDPGEHARIVGRPTHERTLENIRTALERGIELRAGLIRLHDQQRIGPAVQQLEHLGITRLDVDHVRQVGHGRRDRPASTEDLCGWCATGKLAILPSGDAHPCVFSRWDSMRVGNVRHQSLEEIIAGQTLAAARALLESEFAARQQPSGSTRSPARLMTMPPFDVGDPTCSPGDECAPNIPPCKPNWT
jgi:MoaA/NifB/PqqE/SkfB family radical SAM enzyme